MHKQTIGSVRLRAWMKKTGTTQVQVAEQLDTAQQNVSAWLLGRPAPLKYALALKVLAKIPPEAWLEEAPAESGTDVSEAAARSA